MSSKSSSSMEQGELEASPVDFRHDYFPVSLNLDINMINSSQQRNDSLKTKSPEPIIEEEDALQIQPPQPIQLNIIKFDKKDKQHRHHREDSINNYFYKDKISRSLKSYEDNAIEKDETRIHKSSKELDRELQRRLDKQKRDEQDQIRRKNSLQERERLEKLERERRKKEIELQSEIARIHNQKKLERRSRHSKKSTSKEKKDKKDSSLKIHEFSSKKRRHSPSSALSKRDPKYRKSTQKEPSRKKYLSKEDLFNLDLTNKPESMENNLNKINSNNKHDDNRYESSNSQKESVNLVDYSSSYKFYNEYDYKNINRDVDDNENNNDNIDLVNKNSDYLKSDHEDLKHYHSQSDDDVLSNQFCDPSKIKSKFDDPSDSEEGLNHTSSLKSDSKSSSAAFSQSSFEIEPSPISSPLENYLPVYYPALQGCRNVEEFHCLNRIEEGTYGVVYRAIDIKTEEIVALKRLKMEKEKEGFPITSLREINTLLKAQHINIVTVREIVVGSNMDKIYIVMDYVEHDLKSLMEYMKEPFIIGEVKTLMLQLMRGVKHLHDNWIIHRDLKASNLLLSHKGILKIGDFGLAREYGSPLKPYTSIVVTLWYRSPELLLGTKEYSTPIDMWSVGCIYAELLTKKPLFPGKTEIDELNRIFKELGTPNEKIWPGVSELPAMKKCTFTDYPYNQLRQRFGSTLSDRGFDLLNKLLTYDPSKRSTAKEALGHDFFEESPLPVHPNMFPTRP